MLEQTLIDYNGTDTYIGRAYAGAETSSPNWAITKIEHDATGKVLSVKHSNGTYERTSIWDNRKEVEYA